MTMPHASPAGDWRHSWCDETCEHHSVPVVARQLLAELLSTLSELVTQKPDAVAGLAIREVRDAARMVIRRCT